MINYNNLQGLWKSEDQTHGDYNLFILHYVAVAIYQCIDCKIYRKLEHNKLFIKSLVH